MEEKTSSNNLRNDLLLFKEETLKDIKKSEKSLLEKYRNTEFIIMQKIENFENKFNKFNEKILEITTFIDSLKDIKNTINSLFAYKSKSENSLIDLDLKLRSLDKETHDSLFNINNILKSSVIYPGTIGNTSKFKTFHNFIDYILEYIKYEKQFKEKISREVTDNRIKQDNNIEKLKTNYNIILDKVKSLINNEIKKVEDNNKTIFNSIDEKLLNMRLENKKHDMSIEEIEQLINNINEQIKEIDNKKSELFSKYNNLNEYYTQNNKEINSLKENYYSLNNYIKQINPKNSIRVFNKINHSHNEKIDGQNILSLQEELNTENKEILKSKFKKNESRLKEYIKGNININQLQTFNKTNNKSFGALKDFNYNENEEDKKLFLSSEKSKTFNAFPSFKIKEKEKYSKTINNIEDNNQNCNSLRSNNKNIDNYFKINTITPLIEKTSDLNLNSEKKYEFLKNIGNISLNLEGNEILKINPKETRNKKYKNIMQNVKDILQKNNDNKINKSKYLSGYPRIMTNQGERIIISSHPIYNKNKFTKINPNLFSLNKNIQTFYGNNKKENKITLVKNKKNKDIE